MDGKCGENRIPFKNGGGKTTRFIVSTKEKTVECALQRPLQRRTAEKFFF
jgi:hypothetical protein